MRLKPGDDFTDQRPRVRRLGQKIISYGRLRDFLGVDKPETWQRLEANYLVSTEDAQRAQARADTEIQDLRPYIVPTQPHYHFYNDKIGIRLANPDDVTTYPELSPEVADANTDHCSLHGGEMEPDFWLSPGQMLHLAFYTYLQRRDDQCLTPDVVLLRYRSGLQKLLRQLSQDTPDLDGDPESTERRAAAQGWIDGIFGVGAKEDSPEIYLGELPKVVARTLLGTDEAGIDAAAINKRIEHLINDSEKRIKHVDALLKSFKKRGKPRFKSIRAGPIAAFLTDDLLRFQPIDPKRIDAGSGKINSQQYLILKAALANYAIHIDEPPRIVELLHNAHLLDGPMQHPFLHRLGLAEDPDQFSGLMSFYRAYLRGRISFLEEERQRFDTVPAPVQPQPWLRMRQRSSLKNWLMSFRDAKGNLAEEFRALPVPANLLYQPVLVALARALGTTPGVLLNTGSRQVKRNGHTVTVRPALTWFMQYYLEQQNDSAQEMYSYKRRYDFFDACLDTRKNKQKYQERPSKPLSERERREALEQIRRGARRGPDWKQLDDDGLRNLHEAYKRHERRIRHLSTQDMALFLHGRDFFEKHVRLPKGASKPAWSLRDIESAALKTAIDIELLVPDTDRTLRHPSCKVRNLGEFGLLVRDKRLPSLLLYYPASETVIDQAEIRAELISYRRMRVEIMEMVHELELSIVKITNGAAVGDVPKSKQDTFGKGCHGKLLHELHQLWSRTETGKAESFDAAFGYDRFRQALELRNAIAHNQYPHPRFFDEVTAAMASEPVPNSPKDHRRIAERLRRVMKDLYAPWLAFLELGELEVPHE